LVEEDLQGALSSHAAAANAVAPDGVIFFVALCEAEHTPRPAAER